MVRLGLARTANVTSGASVRMGEGVSKASDRMVGEGGGGGGWKGGMVPMG